MTATGELDSHNTLNTGQQLLTLSLAPRTGSPALQSLIKVPRTPQRGELHSLPLFIHFITPTQHSLPPSFPLSDIPLRPLIRSFVILLIRMTAWWRLTVVPSTCRSSGSGHICSKHRLTVFPWLKWSKLTHKKYETQQLMTFIWAETNERHLHERKRAQVPWNPELFVSFERQEKTNQHQGHITSLLKLSPTDSWTGRHVNRLYCWKVIFLISLLVMCFRMPCSVTAVVFKTSPH